MAGLKRRGFTLIELLTVVAIIGLLIGILVPSVNMAMRKAKATAVRAQLDGITKGMEIFKADFGDYPDSSRSTWGASDPDSQGSIQGAHRLVFALLGRDQLGCPTSNSDKYDGVYYTDSGAAVYDASLWGTGTRIKTPRRGPYIDPLGFNVANDNTTTSATSTYVWLLCDKFDKKQNQPIQAVADYGSRNIILYYKAANNGDNVSKIYNPHDNAKITIGEAANAANLPADNLTATLWSPFLWGQLGTDSNPKPGGIVNTQATVGAIYQPYKKESYLLISAGYDGIFFNDDDVTNWK
ncbi:MAG: prepilin-type N-terminal cleavage/methylation domain-containing protein [Phycisphaerae bacterium]